jgi:hypothetical protein
MKVVMLLTPEPSERSITLIDTIKQKTEKTQVKREHLDDDPLPERKGNK